jgi:transcriptional regulator with XRE-family HTH domain
VKDSEEIAQARRALGRQLAAYRRAAGYSQATFAEIMNYSRSSIANVETGRQRVSSRFWQRADAAVDALGLLAQASRSLQAEIRQERQRNAQSIRPVSSAPAGPLAAKAPAQMADRADLSRVLNAVLSADVVIVAYMKGDGQHPHDDRRGFPGPRDT